MFMVPLILYSYCHSWVLVCVYVFVCDVETEDDGLKNNLRN